MFSIRIATHVTTLTHIHSGLGSIQVIWRELVLYTQYIKVNTRNSRFIIINIYAQTQRVPRCCRFFFYFVFPATRFAIRSAPFLRATLQRQQRVARPRVEFVKRSSSIERIGDGGSVFRVLVLELFSVLHHDQIQF